MAFNKQPLENTEPKSEKSGGTFSPKPQATPKMSGGLSSQPKPKAQPTLDRQGSKALSSSKIQPGSPNKGPKTPVGPNQIKINPKFDRTELANKALANKTKKIYTHDDIPDITGEAKVYTDSHGVRWIKNPDKGDGHNYGYSRVDNPSIISTQPADIGAIPEKGWNNSNETEERKQASKLFGMDLTQNKQTQELPEEFKTEKGVPGKDYSFYEDGTFSTKHRQAASSFEEPSVEYEGLGRFYGLNLENMVYGENGFMKDKYPNGFPDFNGDVLYSSKHWDEFEDWAKEKYGVDLEQIRKDNFKEFNKRNKPYPRF